MCNEIIEIYSPVYNKDGSLSHSRECKMVFGRKDKRCPRCREMINGAPARAGWQKGYYEMKKKNDEMEILARKAHYASHKHLSGGCGPVCTFGEW